MAGVAAGSSLLDAKLRGAPGLRLKPYKNVGATLGGGHGSGTGGGGGSLGINTQNAGNIAIYPNPAHNIIHIATTEHLKAVLNTVDGRRIMEQEDAKEINISHLADGTYLLLLYNNDGMMVRAQRIMKE